MIQTLSQTYTQDDAQKRIDAARALATSKTGIDNPQAVRAALTTQTFDNDQQLKTAQAGQQSNITALQELSDFDTKLAGQYSQANKAQLATDNARRAATTAMGAVDGTNAQATIAGGPATFNTADYAISGPTMLNPFVAAGITEGQSNAIQGEFSLADMARSARERYLGSEVTQLTDMYVAQKEEEARKAEEERQSKLRQFELDMDYAQTNGGVVVDPESGKEYKFDTPEEKARKEQAIKNAAEQSVLQKPGRSGKTLAEEVTDGLGSFVDVIRENPALTKDEALALARLNVQKFGGFKESAEQLQSLGLGFIAEDPTLLAGGGPQTDIQGYVDMVKNGQLAPSGVPDAIRDKVVNAVSAQGGIKATDTATDEATVKKNSALNAIDQLEQLYGRGNASNVGTGGDLSVQGRGLIGQIPGLLTRFTKKVGLRPKLAEDENKYKSALNISAGLFTQAMGSGTPQAGEMQNLLNSAPGINTSDAEAQQWFVTMRNLIGQGGGSGLVTMQAPDGMIYQVSPDEVNEAANNGWRKL